MFRNVIVGVDHDDGGRDAITLAMQLLATGGQLTFAHVYAGDSSAYRGVNAAYELSKRQRDLELLTEARAEAGTSAELRWCRASSVGRGLHELCDAARGDLLVVGASRRRGMARAVHGDDTHDVLAGARCALAVAPADYRRAPSDFQEIGVGFDGSPQSTIALRVARELAATYGSRLSAFEAIDTPRHLPDAAGVADVVEAARARLARLLGVEAHAVYGPPTDELTLYSRVVDLLVIGSPGSSPPGLPYRGGVVRELARSSRCPILVVAPQAVDRGNGAMSLPPSTLAHDSSRPSTVPRHADDSAV